MENLVARAEEAFREGRAQEALALFAQVLEIDPGQGRALMGLGAICHGQGRFAEAQGAFGRLLELEPGNMEAMRNLALSLVSAAEYDRARPLLEKLLAENQNDARLWALLARLEKAAGRPKAALEHARRSLLIEPGQPELEAFVSAASATPAPAQAAAGKAERRLFVACPPERDEEVSLVLSRLQGALDVAKVVSLKIPPYLDGASRGGPVWLEGTGQATAALLRERGLLDGRRVLLRLGPDEILSGLPAGLDLSKVSDLVVESLFARDMVLARRPALRPGARLHVVPRAVDLARFKARPDGPLGARIALPGPHGPYSGLIEALSAFQGLKALRPEAELHLSGPFLSPVLEQALAHFVLKSGLAESVFLLQKPPDPRAFLLDKDFILHCPVAAGAHGPAEALHLGLRPLIREAPGQAELFPPEWLWLSPAQLAERLASPPDPGEGRRLVATRHDPDRVARALLALLAA
ncbi:MAG: tetratricopeptide repeat protein [Deltaproteobacteria bacterium]|jgi:tetratricopeptide (TPR) repeat protein|nr:tetratricopeptide repeat protein [Deltaproteobacteria bacterium]